MWVVESLHILKFKAKTKTSSLSCKDEPAHPLSIRKPYFDSHYPETLYIYIVEPAQQAIYLAISQRWFCEHSYQKHYSRKLNVPSVWCRNGSALPELPQYQASARTNRTRLNKRATVTNPSGGRHSPAQALPVLFAVQITSSKHSFRKALLLWLLS